MIRLKGLSRFAITLIPNMPKPRRQTERVRVRISSGTHFGIIFDFHPQLAIAMVEFLNEHLAGLWHANRPDNFASLPNDPRGSISFAS
jgi:hypothetical protein